MLCELPRSRAQPYGLRLVSHMHQLRSRAVLAFPPSLAVSRWRIYLFQVHFSGNDVSAHSASETSHPKVARLQHQDTYDPVELVQKYIRILAPADVLVFSNGIVEHLPFDVKYIFASILFLVKHCDFDFKARIQNNSLSVHNQLGVSGKLEKTESQHRIGAWGVSEIYTLLLFVNILVDLSHPLNRTKHTAAGDGNLGVPTPKAHLKVHAQLVFD